MKLKINKKNDRGDYRNFTMRLVEEDFDLIGALAKKLNVSKTRLVRYLVAVEADKIGMEITESMKEDFWEGA